MIMFEHIIFLTYIYILLFSVIGHGFLFYKLIGGNPFNLNLGLNGIIGFFSIVFISIITSFFTKHGFFHNIILHLVGIFSFLYFSINYNSKFKKDLIKLLLLVLIFLIGMYIFKTHDDFPYYHLTYT